MDNMLEWWAGGGEPLLVCHSASSNRIDCSGRKGCSSKQRQRLRGTEVERMNKEVDTREGQVGDQHRKVTEIQRYENLH